MTTLQSYTHCQFAQKAKRMSQNLPKSVFVRTQRAQQN
jgi:hypothetical protein